MHKLGGRMAQKRKMNHDEIKTLLETIDDPVLKLELVMDLGKRLPPPPPGAACAEVSGCASRVRICQSGTGNRESGIRFYGAADSALVRGILYIILSMANGGVKNPRAEFGALNLNLGAGRLNGVDSMISYLEKAVSG
jgi:sulfur transfer protein SufE